MTTEDSGWVIRGKHVLMALLAMFGLVILVNLVFVVLALETFTGVSTHNPYQEGLAYNEVLAARGAQRDLGWRGGITLAKTAEGDDLLTIALTDKAGEPLRGLALAGVLRRPTHDGMDQSLTWREDTPGSYASVLTLPERGNWDLTVTADDGRHPPFEMKTRLWLK